MSLPPEVDKKIRGRFVDILQSLDEIIMSEPDSKKGEELYEVNRINLSNLILLLTTPRNKLERFRKQVERYPMVSLTAGEKAIQLKRIALGIQKDYEKKMLGNIGELIEANIIADYLGQAERLLTEGQPGKYDHVPAAVLTGAILEDGLRRLCDRNSLPTTDTKGRPKTLNPMIDDLKKAGVFNELKAKQLRAWADIRNAAAHGEFTKFDKKDVEQMLMGVQSFLADYM